MDYLSDVRAEVFSALADWQSAQAVRDAAPELLTAAVMAEAYIAHMERELAGHEGCAELVALRAAIALATQAKPVANNDNVVATNNNNDWIEWNGGPCPVARGTLIDVRDHDGYVWRGVEALKHLAAGDVFWNHEGHHPSSNIVAYRVAS